MRLTNLNILTFTISIHFDLRPSIYIQKLNVNRINWNRQRKSIYVEVKQRKIHGLINNGFESQTEFIFRMRTPQILYYTIYRRSVCCNCCCAVSGRDLELVLTFFLVREIDTDSWQFVSWPFRTWTQITRQKVVYIIDSSFVLSSSAPFRSMFKRMLFKILENLL